MATLIIKMFLEGKTDNTKNLYFKFALSATQVP